VKQSRSERDNFNFICLPQLISEDLKANFCPRNAIIFIFQKLYFLFFFIIVQFSNSYSLTIIQVVRFFSLGHWCNYKNLVVCMEVKLLLCLHFATFTSQKLHVQCNSFQLFNIQNAINPFLNIFKHTFDL
jgi:hypothetical protein